MTDPAIVLRKLSALREHTARLARRLAGMAALRNRIAHGYASVDFARIWSELPDRIAALNSLQAAVARHLGGGAWMPAARPCLANTLRHRGKTPHRRSASSRAVTSCCCH